MSSHKLIAGAGKFGKRFFHYLKANHTSVYTLSKSPKPWSEQHICCDLLADKTAIKKAISKLPKIDQLYFILSPTASTEDEYKKTYIQAVTNLLDALQSQQKSIHCTFLSSIGVYGKEQVGIINENTLPKPDGFRGKIMLEAEQNMLQKCNAVTIVRAAGLYSSQRLRLIESIMDIDQRNNPKWLNLIHEQDLCQWIELATHKKWALTHASDAYAFQRKNAVKPSGESPSLMLKDKSYRLFKSQHFEQIKLDFACFTDWLAKKEF